MTLLQLLLRLIGTSSLLALVFVAAPHSWMRDIHAALGMGELPDAPVVWYLARSTSAFYAILGGLFWVVSFDPTRYRSVLLYLGSAVVLLGVSLLSIDFLEGMPLFWWVWEGPFVTAFGLTILALTPGRSERR
jgi:hypothetical protein